MMKNDTSDLKEDTSSSLEDLFSVAQLYGNIWLREAGSSLFLQLRSIGKFAATAVIEYLTISLAGLYLLYFGIIELLLALDVSPRYAGPIFAGLMLFLVMSFKLLSSSVDKNIKEDKRDDLKKLANLKRSSMSFFQKIKGMIENPLTYTKDQTSKFVTSFAFKDFKKYKTIALPVIIVVALYGYKSIFPRNKNIKSANTAYKAQYGIQHKGATLTRQELNRQAAPDVLSELWDPIKRFILTSVAAMIAPLIKDFISSVILEIHTYFEASKKNSHSEDKKMNQCELE